MDKWYESFEGILAIHQDKFVTASAPTHQSILKTICNQIVTKHKSLEDPAALPKPLRKAIRRYYLQFLTDEDDIQAEGEFLEDEQDNEALGVSPEEREMAARPKDAAFYKKEITDWDVAQKLFKQEIDDYDKEEQSKLGGKHSIKFRTGHARDWFNNMTPAQREEVEDAKEKWNREGAPAEAQAMYRKRNLKRVLDDFTEQIHRTMGCQVVMLVSHKKKSDQTLSVVVHESKPLNGKKVFTQSSRGNKEWTSDAFTKFAEWSKSEFYPEDSDGVSDNEDDEDDTKDKLPELVLDKTGYAKLPSRAGINAKGQQELVRRIFHALYSELMSVRSALMGLKVGWVEVFTDSTKPVPWREVVAKPSLYLDLECLPKGFLLRDPSHLRADDITKLWDHWEVRRAAKQRLIIFLAGKLADMSKESLQNAVPYKGDKKVYVEISQENEDDTSAKPPMTRTEGPAGTKAASSASASTRPTPHTKGPAGTKAASSASASTPPTPRTKGPAGTKAASSALASTRLAPSTISPADDDSSEDDLATTSFAGHTTGPAARPSGAQEGAPAAVPMKDRVQFLKSLSNNDKYLLLVEGVRDLEKGPSSEEQRDWPTWATWSWEESYLPNAVHSEDGVVENFLDMIASAKITSLPSGMRVTLGLGLLLRECKRAIKYEVDEAPHNTPTYLGASTLDIKILSLVEDLVDTVRGRMLPTLKGREGQQRAAEQEEKERDHELEVRQHLEEELRMLEEAKSRNKRLKDDMQKLQEETKKLVEENESLERQRVEVEHNGESEAEVRVEVKGKKRSKLGESGKPHKITKTDDIRRSSRARLPSKKAMKY
ncbi:uncharacterized protein F5147DRAFT_779937 [Suillus discolor]|uniref:Uncharacterized protein n=1 Tax=Suillus discolor TaxID=1912936 RepID=A0A9P7JNA6_9AGAM|nr:uncharacterized protein F5147DRAFT_779937 [Suillus discolor]KAG2091656.1 hypothetical protein F5147DRAFT_779937 [Suillus discolor]